MRPTGPVLLYGGVAVAVAGFALIAFTWGRVAALESVALQLPYLVSGGLTGLGLVIVGATTVNVYAKQREGAQRERQTQQLLEILRQVTNARQEHDRSRMNYVRACSPPPETATWSVASGWGFVGAATCGTAGCRRARRPAPRLPRIGTPATSS